MWIILSRGLRWKEKQKREKQHNNLWIKTGILNLNWDFVQFKIAQKRSQRRGKEWVNESGESSPSKSGKIKSPGITVILRKMWASQRQNSLSPWLSNKESACNAGDIRYLGWIHGSGKSWRKEWQCTPIFLPGESMDRGGWWAI